MSGRVRFSEESKIPKVTKAERETRLAVIIALRAKGYTFTEIGRDERVNLSERQVRRDWKKANPLREDFVEELIRRQVAQIESLVPDDDYKVKLQYRDALISKLLPRPKEGEASGVSGVEIKIVRAEGPLIDPAPEFSQDERTDA